MNRECQMPIIAPLQPLVILLKTSVSGWISGLRLNKLWEQQLTDVVTDLTISYNFIRDGFSGDHLI